MKRVSAAYPAYESVRLLVAPFRLRPLLRAQSGTLTLVIEAN
jgi:hypothetical protein